MRRRLRNGDERIDRGYIRVYTNGKWLLKQRVLWERNYGAIPEGYYICFLDGDRTNLSLENLACVPVSVLRSVNKTLGHNRHPEITKTLLLIDELERATKEVRVL